MFILLHFVCFAFVLLLSVYYCQSLSSGRGGRLEPLSRSLSLSLQLSIYVPIWLSTCLYMYAFVYAYSSKL